MTVDRPAFWVGVALVAAVVVGYAAAGGDWIAATLAALGAFGALGMAVDSYRSDIIWRDWRGECDRWRDQSHALEVD